jgi:hypothetical protein
MLPLDESPAGLNGGPQQGPRIVRLERKRMKGCKVLLR